MRSAALSVSLLTYSLFSASGSFPVVLLILLSYLCGCRYSNMQDLSDEMFLKRHNKPELDEKRRKRFVAYDVMMR